MNDSQDNELRDFIVDTVRQVREAEKKSDEKLNDAIHFKIAVTKTDTKGGKIGVKVIGLIPVVGTAGALVNGQGEWKNEHASEIGFSFRDKQDNSGVGPIQTRRR